MEKAAYLDTTVFTCACLNTDKTGEAAKKLLTLIIKGKIKCFTSALTFDELFWVLTKKTDHKTAVDYTKNFLNIPRLRFVPAGLKVVWKAHDVLSENKLGPRDAIHTASALLKGAKTIVSEDSDFDKIADLKRVSLTEFGV